MQCHGLPCPSRRPDLLSVRLWCCLPRSVPRPIPSRAVKSCHESDVIRATLLRTVASCHDTESPMKPAIQFSAGRLACAVLVILDPVVAAGHFSTQQSRGRGGGRPSWRPGCDCGRSVQGQRRCRDVCSLFDAAHAPSQRHHRAITAPSLSEARRPSHSGADAGGGTGLVLLVSFRRGQRCCSV